MTLDTILAGVQRRAWADARVQILAKRAACDAASWTSIAHRHEASSPLGQYAQSMALTAAYRRDIFLALADGRYSEARSAARQWKRWRAVAQDAHAQGEACGWRCGR